MEVYVDICVVFIDIKSMSWWRAWVHLVVCTLRCQLVPAVKTFEIVLNIVYYFCSRYKNVIAITRVLRNNKQMKCLP
jgi:hypothetical protein